MCVCPLLTLCVCGSLKDKEWHGSSEENNTRSGLAVVLIRTGAEALTHDRVMCFFFLPLIRKLKLSTGKDLCVQQLVKEEDLG